MPVSYAAGLKSTRMQAVIAAVDANGAGTLEIGTGGVSLVLAILALSLPSFAESNGIITMAGVPLSAIGSAMGNAASARIKDGSGNVIVSGLSVGTYGTDIVLDSVSITSGKTVTLMSFTITHSP
jgi:hypothetical protein